MSAGSRSFPAPLCVLVAAQAASMAYAAAAKASYTLPAKYGWYLAGWAFLCTRFDTPQAGRC